MTDVPSQADTYMFEEEGEEHFELGDIVHGVFPKDNFREKNRLGFVVMERGSTRRNRPFAYGAGVLTQKHIRKLCDECGREHWSGMASGPNALSRYCSRECWNEVQRNGFNSDIRGYRAQSIVGHPLATGRGRVLEHWHNYWEAHGRAEWVVEAKKMGATMHHKNGIRHDNRPENLEIHFPGNHGRGWAAEGLGPQEIEMMATALRVLGYIVVAPERIE